jgi:hypothetical protein
MRPRTAQPKVRNYVEISWETNEIKLRLLDELGISNNRLTELAIRALAADIDRRRSVAAAS